VWTRRRGARNFDGIIGSRLSASSRRMSLHHLDSDAAAFVATVARTCPPCRALPNLHRNAPLLSVCRSPHPFGDRARCERAICWRRKGCRSRLALAPPVVMLRVTEKMEASCTSAAIGQTSTACGWGRTSEHLRQPAAQR
jgi:hypothetical protein